MLKSGESISHPTNSLLSFYYEESDEFDHTDRHSQIDDKYGLITKKDDQNRFVSLGIFHYKNEKLELAGVVNWDHLQNDANNPLPNVDPQKSQFTFCAAIENFYERDAFTFVAFVDSYYVVLAIDQNGNPRILYFLNSDSENDDAIFDADFPQYRLTPDFSPGRPIHNVGNDGKYGVFFRSAEKGSLLFQLEKEGLKFVADFTVDPDDASIENFLTFPQTGDSWDLKVQSAGSKPGDRFLQAISNVGNNKETLCHWRLHDGHHAFVRLQKNEAGSYDILPRAFLHRDCFLDDAGMLVDPYAPVVTIASATHADAPDRLVFWDSSHGCVIVALEHDESDNLQLSFLRHIAIDENYHPESPEKFKLFDQFVCPNPYLSPQRRRDQVAFYHASKNKNEGGDQILSEQNDDKIRYRIHVNSLSDRRLTSLDFSDASLLGENVSRNQSITFHKEIHQRDISPAPQIGSQDFQSQLPDGSLESAKKWSKNFTDQLVSKGILSPKFTANQNAAILKEQVAHEMLAARNVYRMSPEWEDHFHGQVQWMPVDYDNGYGYSHDNMHIDMSQARPYLIDYGITSGFAVVASLGIYGYETHFQRGLQKELDGVLQGLRGDSPGSQGLLARARQLVKDIVANDNENENENENLGNPKKSLVSLKSSLDRFEGSPSPTLANSRQFVNDFKSVSGELLSEQKYEITHEQSRLLAFSSSEEKMLAKLDAYVLNDGSPCRGRLILFAESAVIFGLIFPIFKSI